jgi:hypothetical protein
MEADDTEESDERFLRAARRGRQIRAVITIATIVAAGGAIAWYFATADDRNQPERAWVAERLPAEQIPELRRVAGELQRRTEEAAAAWRATIEQPAVGPIETGAEPCAEVPPTKLSPDELDAYVNRTIGSKVDPAFPRVVYRQANEPIANPPALDEILGLLRGVEAHATEGTVTKTDLERVQNARLPTGVVVYVFGDHHEPVTVNDSKVFEPGFARGLAYVYSYDQRRMVCAGKVEVASSKSVSSATFANDSLKRDLEVALFAALAKELHAVHLPTTPSTLGSAQ